MIFATFLSVGDWLLDERSDAVARFTVSDDQSTFMLSNGLVAREFYSGDGFATVSLRHSDSGEEFVRATRPEALVTINGREISVGGLNGQRDMAYLKREWLKEMNSPSGALRLVAVHHGEIEDRISWKRAWRGEDRPWPPPGKQATFVFEGKDVAVDVVYEIYDGAPLISKQIVVRNIGASAFTVDRFTIESLAFVEPESSVDAFGTWRRPNWSVFTDFSFGGMSPSDDKNVVYRPDPSYTTQVNFELKTPVVMDVRPEQGVGVTLQPGESVPSFTVYELLQDSTDRERCSLGLRRAYRMLAPWVTESPLMLHLTSVEPSVVHKAIDQAAECGYEVVIFSFGSGLNMEDASSENIARFKAIAEYAHERGVKIGGYSLLASRHIDEENDAINPTTMKPGGMRFGHSPCLLSRWGIAYFENVRRFLTETGFDLLEHDGSYPGDVCASTSHPGHDGLADSQWKQFWKIADFYQWCRSRGIYLNVPDSYFLQGSNKTGMGYRETNWSLPRAQQHVHARQNLYDGTWEKPPTMGWMFTPLVEYHGGGAEATIEPLSSHLADYRQHLWNNLSYGAQACYRGPRLYDTLETKAVVVEAVEWFKKYREILESDVIHVRRADGRRLDAILHVNPSLDVKGMLVVYNPTDAEISEEIEVPLYYSGLRDVASFFESDGAVARYELSRDYKVRVPVTVGAHSTVWYTVR